MEFRVHWIRPDFPRIRGPVWETNKKLAMDAVKKRLPEKTTPSKKKRGTGHGAE
jgi:hypothetical protein